MELNLHEDNGHGWLEVPILKLEELNIKREISTYSYMDRAKGLAYLEEDDDMQLFLENCPEVDLSKVKSFEYERCFVRDLENYERFELTGLETLLLTVKQLSKCGFSTDISLTNGCVICSSHEELGTAITIGIEESSIYMKVERISKPKLPTMCLSDFWQKIENPARKDVENLIFRGCFYYH